MIDRLIIVARNADFPRMGGHYPIAGEGVVPCRVSEGSSAGSNHSELPTNSGMKPVSAATADPSCSTPPCSPEAAPAASGTCPACDGCGWDYVHYICPLAKVWKKDRVTCDLCQGDGYARASA